MSLDAAAEVSTPVDLAGFDLAGVDLAAGFDPVAGSDAAATVLAAWAVIRGTGLRETVLTVPVRVPGRDGVVEDGLGEVDLTGPPTGAELVARCRSALAGLVPVTPGGAADEITLVIGTEVGLRYRAGAVDPVQAVLLAEALAGAVPALAGAPGRPVTELLEAAGRRGQHGRAPVAAPGPAPERYPAFRAWAVAEPDRLALVCGSERIGYGELAARVHRLAHVLIERGVGPDVPVAIALPAGPDLVTGMLAVLAAGGCYLPIDPENPVSRTAFVLDDAGVMLVLADHRWPEGAGGDRPVLRLDGVADQALIAAASPHPPAGPVGADRLGYILYTSGSTGAPKGVAVPESAVATLLHGLVRDGWLAAGDGALFSSAPVFDISTVEIFLPLVTGGHVVVASRDQARTPGEIVRLIDAHDLRFAQATPSAWRPLTEALVAGGRRERLLAVSAGEPLTGELAGRLLAVAGRVINGYGPTETTIYSSTAEITDPDEVTIGVPVAGASTWLVDANDRLVPAGVPGELLIGGPGVARGYLGRPELTAERFVPDRWAAGSPAPDAPADSADSAGRVYRSGDRAWWAPDGRLRLVGRIDQQVKVRGHRIEPGEVESRLNAHPDVAASAVRARELGPGDTRLVAFVVGAGGHRPTLAGIRDWCAAALPGYLVPTVCVPLAELPRTGSGKLDERALPDPAAVRAALAEAGSADRTSTPAGTDSPDGPTSDGRIGPRTPAERAVARVWSAALWVDELDVRDDFFDLGGDSLVATQVTLALQREFLLEVPVRAMFLFPTVTELAAALVRARAAGRFDLPAGPVGERVR